jgi:methionyl-tRNA formyltransferase
MLGAETLKVLGVRVEVGTGEPGTVLDDALLVATGAGALRLTQVQAPGRAPMAASPFLRGRPVPPGTRLH